MGDILDYMMIVRQRDTAESQRDALQPQLDALRPVPVDQVEKLHPEWMDGHKAPVLIGLVAEEGSWQHVCWAMYAKGEWRGPNGPRLFTHIMAMPEVPK